jgi:hypothetical protein
MEIDAQQCLIRWSNMSGTYRCPREMAFQVPHASKYHMTCHLTFASHQAGLPMDKFEPVLDNVPDPDPGVSYIGGIRGLAAE